MKVQDYFNSIRDETEKAFDRAEEARSQNRDPEPRVDIPVAEDLPEKASSLVIAAMFPELEDQGVADRIKELENEYGKNDERVAFEISKEIAEGRFHHFEELEKGCDAGVRVGVSYMTGGITTAPLEGIGDVRIRENSDGSEYLAVYYSGPIRSAGGTASAMSVLLADYVRKSVDLAEFDPSETIVKRYSTEVDDYYNRVTAKQYYPEREETEFIAEHVPVEVTGSPTEQLDVTNYKDLDQIDTNQIRGGMCLVYLDGLPLKAPKIKKRIEKWGEEFGLEHWTWVKDYLELQEEIHSSADDESDEDTEEAKYTPSDKYLGSLTAGRPVFGHPGEKGGFRLRYAHTRTNGLAATSFHPATMEVTDRFLATGTQMKIEYPGKATVGTPSDAAHPPIVRLETGTVKEVNTREEAREMEEEIEEILFLGDILVPYGEFVENGKKLLPSPYVPEWWEKELEKTLEEKEMKLGKDFSDRDPSPEEALKISEATGVPMHPKWTHHWQETSLERFKALYRAFNEGEAISADGKAKKCLEDILAQHQVIDGEVAVAKQEAKAIRALLATEEDNTELLENLEESEDIPKFIENVSGMEVRQQAPHYIGARMGRPEKAEKRLIDGRPQMLFPCGKKEGGRMRNLSASYTNTVNGDEGIVNQGIIHYRCPECGELRYFARCNDCGVGTREVWFCRDCGREHDEKVERCDSCGEERMQRFKFTDIDVKQLMDEALDNLDMKEPPELLKSVRGMSSKHKHVEPIEKGLLRQKHGLYVNKDGTVRYDASDLPMSHFKPREISVSVEKLKELGYTHDVDGEPLRSEDQVLEMKPQDIVIPDGENTLPASEYFVDVAKYIDELLEEFYGLEPYYNAETKEDLIGELVVGLAPHTSGGTLGRIIGFTDAKGIYSHPYWHAAKRRNCLPGSEKVQLSDGTSVSLEKIFERSDNPKEVDSTGTVEKEIDLDIASEKSSSNIARKVIRAPAQDHKLSVKTSSGRKIEFFPDHQVMTEKGKKKARSLSQEDVLLSPLKVETEEKEVNSIELTEFVDCVDVCLRGETDKLNSFIGSAGGLKQAAESLGINKKTLGNYRYRDSVPLKIVRELENITGKSIKISKDSVLSAKRDTVELKNRINVDSDFMELLGFYVAEGYCRKSEKQGEEFYQVCFAFGEEPLKNQIEDRIRSVFGISPTEGENVLTISSRLIYELFENLEVGKGAHEKRVPELIQKADKRKKASFLSAYFSGDGSVEKDRLHVAATSVSRELLQDIDGLLKEFGIFVRYSTSVREAGGVLLEKYGEKYQGQKFTSHKLHIRSSFAVKFGKEIGFTLHRKQKSLEESYDIERKPRIEIENNCVKDPINSIETMRSNERFMYDIEVESTHKFITSENIVTHNCDGDEDAIMLLMDGLLNFSRQFLPDMTGARTMDAPLILSTVLNADEIDDEAWAIETVDEYPLEFYQETLQYKPPWELDCDIKIGEDIVYGDEPFDHSYTHDSKDVENGPTQSEYVTLDDMAEKTEEQLGLGKKTKAVDENKVAELLLKKHFIPDIKGNLRSFSAQKMRCVDCNKKFRRVPVSSQTIAASGKTTAECPECGGKVLLTISEGTVKKYMIPSEEIIDEYAVSPYVRQQILILKRTLQSLFGKDNRQSGLGQFT